VTGPRVAVLGSGANGSSIGADLHAAGVDVTLIEQWPAHVEAIRERGVTIRMPDRELLAAPPVMHLCEVATLRQSFDIVLMLVKAYDSRWAAELIRPYLAEDGLLAAVQNGMSTRDVAAVVGADRTMGTVIEISSTMSEPGLVHRHSGPERSWFAVGGLPGSAARGREEEVATLLRHSGTVAVVDDIEATKWMKLVSNATVLVPTASLGLPMLDALSVPGMRELMVRSGREALDVGRVIGHPILPIFGLDEAAVAARESVVDTLLDTLYAGFVRAGATTTILQDWTKGRHSEVDDINGTVAREGRRVGVATPVNDAVIEIAHRIESGELTPEPANLERILGAIVPTGVVSN
jgi:2-dehydropantoate 2-reductase